MMRLLSQRARAASTALLGLLGATHACAGPSSAAVPVDLRLVEKGQYQALYGVDGQIIRLLFDADGDKRADAVILYDSRGKPASAEIDTNRDGVVDRWEVYDESGRLVSSAGSAPDAPGSRARPN